MPTYRFRIVNVFVTQFGAQGRLTGNPLCVFEDARGMDDATMQALAQQFNLSETTFVLPSAIAVARIRTFTPTFEMSFAGHPTLGSAHVVRDLLRSNLGAASGGAHDDFALETGAGAIPVRAEGDTWCLQANAPKMRMPLLASEEIARLTGLTANDLAAPPQWVNTGNDQLLLKLNSPDALARCRVDAAALTRLGEEGPAAKVYLWAFDATQRNIVRARFFFTKHASVEEDPGTGSACANLGGYLILSGAPLPLKLSVLQGEFVQRPNRLELEVDSAQRILVRGRVVELGQGSVSL